MPATRAEKIAAVRAHALDHYNKGGWDILVECWSDDEIAECFGDVRDCRGAIRACAKALRSMDEYRRDIQGA
jgi:hypothetical protein